MVNKKQMNGGSKVVDLAEARKRGVKRAGAARSAATTARGRTAQKAAPPSEFKRKFWVGIQFVLVLAMLYLMMRQCAH